MKILVLTSRYTATRDIIGEDFGRQTRLFSALRKLNHEIDFFVADYRKLEDKKTKLHRINVTIVPFSISHFFGFLKRLDTQLKSKKYDFVIASSDPLWGIIGYIIAKRNNAKFVYDLHDNYETYSTYKIPFFKYMDNAVLRKADLVTTVSHTLMDKIKSIRKDKVFVIQNGVDTNIFRPMDKPKCRKALNLPQNAKIIVYTGSIQRLQGINLLVEAFKVLKKYFNNLRLVIAGRFVRGEENKISLNHDGIIYLKSLTQENVAKLVNASDVAVIPNPENNFTKYCFPYKLVEYMACNANIVATDVGDVGLFLKNFKGSLCKENDVNDMIAKINFQLNKKKNAGKTDYRQFAMKNSWENIATHLDKILRANAK